MGYVYVVKEGHLYKIGMTHDIKTRMTQYKTSTGEHRIVYLIETDDFESLEKELHEIFKERRTRGEWFKLTGDDLKKIKQMPLNFVKCNLTGYVSKRIIKTLAYSPSAEPDIHAWFESLEKQGIPYGERIRALIKGEESQTSQFVTRREFDEIKMQIEKLHH